MVEEVFIDDLRVRGVEVIRSCQFVRHKTQPAPKDPKSLDYEVEVECDDLKIGGTRTLKGQFLVGCDGAHSRVRRSMLGAEMDGESSNSIWGVLDGKKLIHHVTIQNYILTVLQELSRQTSRTFGVKL